MSLCPCSPALIELRNSLVKEIPDEGEAAARYREAATKFTHIAIQEMFPGRQYAEMDPFEKATILQVFPLGNFSETLHMMAGDEITHKSNLEAIVSMVDTICKCDKEAAHAV